MTHCIRDTKILLAAALLLSLSACEHEREDHLEAQASYDQIKNSTSPNALFRVAESMRKQGNFEVAAKSYEQALQIDPTNASARLGLSQCLRLSGRPSAALRVLNAVPENDREVYWYKELGNVYTASQKPRQCIDAYKKAHTLKSDDVGAINGLGVCHDLLGQHSEAQNWYRQAMALSPTDNHLKSNMGLSLALSNHTDEAITLLHEVTDHETSTQRDRQNLAVAYGLSGDLDTASKLFAQDLSMNEVRKNIAFVHKLAQTQKNVSTAPELQKQFETNLSAQAPTPTSDALNRDSHVVVSPLPTKEPYHNEPTPSNQPTSMSLKSDVVEATPAPVLSKKARRTVSKQTEKSGEKASKKESKGAAKKKTAKKSKDKKTS